MNEWMNEGNEWMNRMNEWNEIMNETKTDHYAPCLLIVQICCWFFGIKLHFKRQKSFSLCTQHTHRHRHTYTWIAFNDHFPHKPGLAGRPFIFLITDFGEYVLPGTHQRIYAELHQFYIHQDSRRWKGVNPFCIGSPVPAQQCSRHSMTAIGVDSPYGHILQLSLGAQ